MRRRTILGSAASLLLSGCLRLTSEADGSAATERPMATATTAEPSTTVDRSGGGTETGDEGYPSGVSDDGASVWLADAHANALAGASYALRFESRNATESSVHERLHARVEGDRAVADRTNHHSATVYFEGGERLWRSRPGGTTAYGRNDGGFTHGYGTRRDVLEFVVRAGAFGSPERVERDGGTLYRLEAEGVDDPAALVDEYEGDEMREFAATLLVAPSGVVRTMEADFTLRRGESLPRIQVTLTVEDVGATRVETPDWVATARERAPRLDVRVTDDGRYVEYAHAGGMATHPETTVGLNGHGAGDERHFELAEPFEAGETLYLGIDGAEPKLGRGEPPALSDPVVLGDEFWTHMSLHQVSYFEDGTERL